jgi:hypothetical protein
VVNRLLCDSTILLLASINNIDVVLCTIQPSIATIMVLSQDEMKAQLKQLMQVSTNLVCVDCNDKRPMWASLIVPPPGSSMKDPIGCFCCYQCSGAHRRMGTHICFVRSTNLDECK